MDSNLGESGLSTYPSSYDFCKKIREYEQKTPEEELGMSPKGKVMSEKEFNKAFGQIDTTWGWTKSWAVTIKDPDGFSFLDYKNNMVTGINTCAESMHLSDRGIKACEINSLTPTGLKPFVVNIEESAKTPFLSTARIYGSAKNQKVPCLPTLKEGDYDHFMGFLKSKLPSGLTNEIETENGQRAFFQELNSINSRIVEELATRVSSSYRDEQKENKLLDYLKIELVKRRSTAGEKLSEAHYQDLPDKKELVTTSRFKGHPIETSRKQVDFATPIETSGLSLQELQDLDYQLTTDASLLEVELAENKKRARDQGEAEEFSDARHGKFQQLLDGITPLGRSEYLYSFKMMSKELPASGIAGADGNVAYGMEDVVVAQRQHAIIAGQWQPVRITAVLDGHTVDLKKETGDNSAAVESGKLLPKTLASRLTLMNSKKLTRTGMVAACQTAVVDLDRRGDYRSGGSSLNCAAVIGKHLCIINTGDSRSLFIDPNKAPSEKNAFIQLSEDAELLPEQEKPENAMSRFNKMVNDRGGLAVPHPRKPDQIRVKSMDTPEGEHGMSCVATIGDHHYNGVTSPKPFVTVYEKGELDPNGYLIQFCDGIPEVATNEQITRLVKKLCTENPDISPENLAASIRDHAFKASSQDNLTVIVTKVSDLF